MYAFTPVAQLPDTTKALWERLYMVRLPRLEATTIEYLQTYGTYITGDRAIDQTSANQLITTMKPIHELADYHRQHVPIRLVHVNDALEIYQAVQNHLEAWQRKLQYGLNTRNAPVNDLMALESFARTVYSHARHYMPPKSHASLFIQSLFSPMTLTVQNLFKTPLTEPEPAEVTVINGSQTPEEQPTDHIASFLKNHINTLNLQRGRYGTQ